VLPVGPRFIKQNESWRAVQPLLDSPEQIKQHWDNRFVIELQKIFRFESEQSALAKHVHIGVEKRAERTHDSEVL
jgi:hypothetical protein